MAAWIPGAALLLLGVVESSRSTPNVVVDGSCEDAAALRQQLRAALPEAPGALTVELAVAADDTIQHGRLSFELDGVPHQRSLSAESCGALYEASALVIALAIQPGPHIGLDESASGASAVPEPEPEPEPVESSDAPESLPPPVPTTDPEPNGTNEAFPSSAPPSLAVRGRVGGGLALGVIHPVHPMIAAGVELLGHRWIAGIDARYLPPVTARVDDARATLQLGAAGARGCARWHFVDGRLTLPLCAGLTAGLAWGRGEGESVRGRSGRESWVAATLGPRLRLHAAWGGDLWIATEVLAPLRRLNFVIGEGRPACCQSPLGGLLSIGGAWSGPLGRRPDR